VKVVHLTSVHPPFDTRIFHKEAKTLHQAGYRVVLIVPDVCDIQVIDGVHIKTIKPSDNRFLRFTCTMWQIYKAARREAAELYHFHDPELLLVGWLLGLQGKKVIYDVHEDVPKDILAKHWVPKWMRKWIAKLVGSLELLVVHCLAGVVAATPAIARRFPASKTVVVQNFPIPDEPSWKNEISVYKNRSNKMVYVGALTPNRGAYQMIEAVSRTPPDFQAQLVLAARFAPAGLLDELRLLDAWKTVSFLGWLSREQVRKVLRKAKVGLVIFHPDPNHIEAQPNKLFEYMSAGLPVIASDFPLWREIVGNEECGLLVDPLDTQAIAEAIQWLLEHTEDAEEMGKRGRRAVETRYNWELEAHKLLKFYEGLLL